MQYIDFLEKTLLNIVQANIKCYLCARFGNEQAIVACL